MTVALKATKRRIAELTKKAKKEEPLFEDDERFEEDAHDRFEVGQGEKKNRLLTKRSIVRIQRTCRGLKDEVEKLEKRIGELERRLAGEGKAG